MLGAEMGGTWFAARSAGAIAEFFEICDATLAANEASARELERLRPGAVEDLGERVAQARQRHRAARDGDWAPFESHLRALGERFAREGLPFEDWYRVVQRFYDSVVPSIVEACAHEPRLLAEVLLVLGDYNQRSLALIERAYADTRSALAREVEERNAEVLDAALDAVITIDGDGKVTELNRAAVTMFGHAREHAIGRSLAELIVPERLRAAHSAGLARARRGEYHVIGRRVEVVAMRANGQEFPVELSLLATRVNDQPAFTAFLRDLTERKQAEASVAVWQHALDHAQFGIVISGIDSGIIHSVNSTYATMMGFRADELAGSSGHQLIADASRGEMAEIAKRLTENKACTYETWLRRRDGTSLLVLVSTSTVEIQDGFSVRVSTVIDIDQRHRLEEAMRAGRLELEQAANRLRIISTTSHEFASAAGDPEALLALVARRLAEILGDACAARLLSEDGEWIEPSHTFFHADPAIRTKVGELLARTRQRVGDGLAGRAIASRGPVVLPQVSGSIGEHVPEPVREVFGTLPIRSALAVPLVARDRTIGVVSLFRIESDEPYSPDDVQLATALGDRAGLALDNAMLVTTLERRVGERTAALEAANRELESFSYSVSHDLRAPLRAVNAAGHMLVEDYEQALDATARDHVARILAGTKRMGQLIDDLLDLARIARTPLRIRQVDLSALAAEVIGELRHRDPRRIVTVEIQPGLAAPGDPRLLRIVLENLLGNAWKFTARTASPQISFSYEDGRFCVRDNGAGFDMTYASRLFVPFQRLHGAQEFEGTGVGLATVDRIIRHHGGAISATSVVGQGATFTFTLCV